MITLYFLEFSQLIKDFFFFRIKTVSYKNISAFSITEVSHNTHLIDFI